MYIVPVNLNLLNRLEAAWYNSYASYTYTRAFMYWCEDKLGAKLSRRGCEQYPFMLKFKKEKDLKNFINRFMYEHS